MDLTFTIAVKDNETGKILKEIRQEIMAQSTEMAEFRRKFDEHTSRIASRLQELINRQSGMSAEDKAELTAMAQVLENTGKDESNPFPPVPVA